MNVGLLRMHRLDSVARMDHRTRKFIAAVGVALAVSATIADAAGVAPKALRPTDGKGLAVGQAFTFSVRAHRVRRGSVVVVRVSSKPGKGADGLIGDDQYLRRMNPKAGGVFSKKVDVYPDLKRYFLNHTGTYYWQAYRVDCTAAGQGCKLPGGVRRFTLR